MEGFHGTAFIGVAENHTKKEEINENENKYSKIHCHNWERGQNQGMVLYRVNRELSPSSSFSSLSFLPFGWEFFFRCLW